MRNTGLVVGLFAAVALLMATTYPAYVSNSTSDANDLEIIGITAAWVFFAVGLVLFIYTRTTGKDLGTWWAGAFVAGIAGYAGATLAQFIEAADDTGYLQGGLVIMGALLLGFVWVGMAPRPQQP